MFKVFGLIAVSVVSCLCLDPVWSIANFSWPLPSKWWIYWWKFKKKSFTRVDFLLGSLAYSWLDHLMNVINLGVFCLNQSPLNDGLFDVFQAEATWSIIALDLKILSLLFWFNLLFDLAWCKHHSLLYIPIVHNWMEQKSYPYVGLTF